MLSSHSSATAKRTNEMNKRENNEIPNMHCRYGALLLCRIFWMTVHRVFQ